MQRAGKGLRAVRRLPWVSGISCRELRCIHDREVTQLPSPAPILCTWHTVNPQENGPVTSHHYHHHYCALPPPPLLHPKGKRIYSELSVPMVRMLFLQIFNGVTQTLAPIWFRVVLRISLPLPLSLYHVSILCFLHSPYHCLKLSCELSILPHFVREGPMSNLSLNPSETRTQSGT